MFQLSHAKTKILIKRTTHTTSAIERNLIVSKFISSATHAGFHHCTPRDDRLPYEAWCSFGFGRVPTSVPVAISPTLLQFVR